MPNSFKKIRITCLKELRYIADVHVTFLYTVFSNDKIPKSLLYIIPLYRCRLFRNSCVYRKYSNQSHRMFKSKIVRHSGFIFKPSLRSTEVLPTIKFIGIQCINNVVQM